MDHRELHTVNNIVLHLSLNAMKGGAAWSRSREDTVETEGPTTSWWRQCRVNKPSLIRVVGCLSRCPRSNKHEGESIKSRLSQSARPRNLFFSCWNVLGSWRDRCRNWSCSRSNKGSVFIKWFETSCCFFRAQRYNEEPDLQVKLSR